MPRRAMARRGPRPRYVWVPGRDVENSIASGTDQTADLLANYVTDTGRQTGPGFVIERILGSLIVESQTNGSGGDFALGITTVVDGGFVAGGAPDVQADMHDWLVWISGGFSSGVNEQAAGVFQPDQWVYRFDVKARRRLRATRDEVRGVMRNPNSTSLLWSLQTRILMRVT